MQEKINKLIKQIDKAQNILISAHIAPDGDAIGSSFGLCLILRNMGKNAFVVKNDEYPKYINFMYRDDIYFNDEFEKADLFISVDSADKERIGSSAKYMDEAEDTAIIDHHITNKGYSNNDIIYMSSSASEMVAEIFINSNIEIPKEAANYLYLGIMTDTYRFQYDAADAKTLENAAKLIRLGADKKKIQEELYDRLDVNQLFLQVEVIKNATRIGKQIITAKITKDLVAKFGMTMDDAEGLVSMLRTINGIEVSAIAKEESEEETKLSFRSQAQVDVSKIAVEFGGGGHVRASGATVKGNIDQVFARLYERMEKLYEDGDLSDK